MSDNGRSAASWEIQVLGRKLWRARGIVERNLGGFDEKEVKLAEIRIKMPQDDLGDFLVVVKGSSHGRKFVAFHRSDDVAGAITGALERFHAEKLKWREDAFAGDASVHPES